MADVANSSTGENENENDYEKERSGAVPVFRGAVRSGGSALETQLLEDRDKFLRAFIEHLCTYALRRVLTFDDREDLKAIEEEVRKNGYGLRDIVRAVALSDLMRKR